MRPVLRSRLAVLAFVTLVAPRVLSAEVIDNVLLRWREQVAKCGHPAFGELYTLRDVAALVPVAMFEAVNAIAGKYTPYVARIAAPPGSSMEAAAAQAAHDVLVQTCAAEARAFDAELHESLAAVPDSVARERGITVGRQAAAAVLAARAASKANGSDPFMTAVTPGAYVPTLTERGRLWSQMTPWILKTPSEVRPPAPPALTSAVWSRDLREVQRLGGKKSASRTRAQTDVALFWAPRDVRIVLRQLVGLPGRTLVADARFLALAEMAWADSFVAMMDGKYAYNFWRPVTAIRYRASEGGAPSLDAAWEPLLTTPPHPEYPCGHCLSAAAVGAVIAEEFGDRMPAIVLDQENALPRRYAAAQEYIDEVTASRVLGGVHYRFSAEAGKAAGIAIGQLAVQRLLRPARIGAR